MNAGDRIKELRILNNLTQEELGEKVGVKKAAVQKWESGITKNLKRSTIQKLSEIFDVSPTYVMGMSNVKNPSTSKRIPLLGTIAAGLPIMAEENIEDYFNIDSKIKADFALKVKGDSMLGAGIFPGDIVFIKQQCSLENGEIGAVLIDDSATLKKFYKENDTIILQSENDLYKPIILTGGNVSILGKLVAVLNIRE
ncbi:transcriptional repressor LexA [Tissierella pigra]|uniref:transcriptional repressor LexA n=1 Tax=Tissierella pigra TaxID=2607614 RepID=UPI001C0F4BB2|nr:transcriptional repressor LexA [Tissierella pigra]MBU5424966.1 transcriptional repressor LexA [Tissierella pigra]